MRPPIAHLALIVLLGVKYGQAETYIGEYKMTGKLAQQFQPYGLWYEDLTAEKTVVVVDKINEDVS